MFLRKRMYASVCRILKSGCGVALVLILIQPGTAFAQRIKMSVKVPELETRVKQDSNDAAAHYNLALGYWSEKRYDEAEKQLRAAIQVEPRFAVAHLGLAFLPFARRSKLFVEAYEDAVP